MGLRDRLDRLEASLSPRYVDTGAKERLQAKLAAISEAHRARRERDGAEPVLEGQSMASLLGLVESYPYGAVSPEVARAARDKAQELSHGPQSPVARWLGCAWSQRDAMSLRRQLRRLERLAEEDMISIPQPNGPPARFPRSAYKEAFLNAIARMGGGESAPPRHPLLEAARNSSDPRWRDSYFSDIDYDGDPTPVGDLSEP